MSVAANEKVPSIIELFEGRLLTFLHVCDALLKGRDYLMGELTVADLALYPVTAGRKAQIDKAGDMPHLTRWMGTVGTRPGNCEGHEALVVMQRLYRARVRNQRVLPLNATTESLPAGRPDAARRKARL